jgi:hemolysin activation/secretion protein
MMVAVAALSMQTAAAQTTPFIIDQNRTDRSAAAPAPSKAPPSAATTPDAMKTFMPFTLRDVRVEGASIDAWRIQSATGPFIGRTIGAADIQPITDAIATEYAASDVGLYTIIAPEQDFTDGVLKITVIEGYIERIEIAGDAGDHDLVQRYGAHLTAERPLRRATLQRYVSLIRDIPGLNPDIQLQTGPTPAAMRLTIAPARKRLMIGLGVNDTGSSLLGRTQFGIDLTYNGLFREGEQTRFSFLGPFDFNRFRYFGFSHTEPLGSDGLLFQFNAGLLKTHPKGTNIRGAAHTLQALFSYPLIRSYDENLSISGSVDALNSENAAIGQSIASERVRALRAAATYSLAKPRSLLSLSGTFSAGLDGFGARQFDPRLAVSDFIKLNALAGFNQQLGESFVVRLRGAGQHGADRLPTSELFALGGPDFGRAFAPASVVGDSGAAGSVELAWRPRLSGRWQGSELYGFVDRETTWYRERFVSSQRFDLASAGFGTRIAISEKVASQLEMARALDAPAQVAREGSWRFNFAVKANY